LLEFGVKAGQVSCKLLCPNLGDMVLASGGNWRPALSCIFSLVLLFLCSFQNCAAAKLPYAAVTFHTPACLPACPAAWVLANLVDTPGKQAGRQLVQDCAQTTQGVHSTLWTLVKVCVHGIVGVVGQAHMC
jgi:uncharacterized integral membrane protein